MEEETKGWKGERMLEIWREEGRREQEENCYREMGWENCVRKERRKEKTK